MSARGAARQGIKTRPKCQRESTAEHHSVSAADLAIDGRPPRTSLRSPGAANLTSAAPALQRGGCSGRRNPQKEIRKKKSSTAASRRLKRRGLLAAASRAPDLRGQCLTRPRFADLSEP